MDSTRSTSRWQTASPEPRVDERNSAYRSSFSRSVAKVNGLIRYCTTPTATADRTTDRSRAEVTAMTSQSTPAARSDRHTSSPCMSGR